MGAAKSSETSERPMTEPCLLALFIDMFNDMIYAKHNCIL